MKTPRQILFERHRSAEPKLEAVRRNALAAISERSAHPTDAEAKSGAWLALSTLLRSMCWHLAGMSAIWLLVAVLNIEHSSAQVISAARENPLRPNQLLLALRENRRQLLELTEPASAESVPAPPPAVVPQRRSEISSPESIA
jgi:hypothetical protein